MYYQRSHPTITIIHTYSLMDEDHLHNEFELVYCVNGSFDAVIDSVPHKVNKGQLSLSFPNQNHYYSYDRESPIDIFILIFSIQVLPEIEKKLETSLPVDPVVSVSDAVFTETLLQKMFENRNKDDFSVLKRSGYLKMLAADIFENMELIPNRKIDPKTLSSIVTYCNNNFTSDIHLSDLEEHLHINKYYISHIFKEKVKMGFNEYIHTLRIEAAQKLLAETDDTITAVAYSVGYNTVRNFNRAFLKFAGMTPKKYRESKAKK